MNAIRSNERRWSSSSVRVTDRASLSSPSPLKHARRITTLHSCMKWDSAFRVVRTAVCRKVGPVNNDFMVV